MVGNKDMYCQNKIVHTIQAGDSLYKLSRQYHTTVTELILGNPGVNPYNLQIGMQLFICPGEGYVPQQNPGGGNMGGGTGNPGGGSMGGGTGNPGSNNETESEREDSILRLNEDMRLAWLNHVYWTRMYLMSAVADNADQQAVEERLLETADEITDVFARYLPIATTRQLRNLLTEHIEIGGQIIQALKAKNMSDYDALVKEWYRNANQMAALFASHNPYFESRETRNMLLNHLDLTREEIEQQVNGEYEQSIDVFRDVEQQALAMADYFARGLLAR
ncbi:LysM domain-containing protein [Roseburia sp. OF03-24]|uniref:LysM peptidoglycan-binding domain-containing protein n=1 Tax=Roseburia sp. OF03-24 TaxID=2292367 RepID=UPI000E4A9A54|nr:LysM domain-containing protein [Roseburia sp. OF03-24]RGX92971.1 LysM domain-containing protein [Roseburia sp. OF03-24]